MSSLLSLEKADNSDVPMSPNSDHTCNPSQSLGNICAHRVHRALKRTIKQCSWIISLFIECLPYVKPLYTQSHLIFTSNLQSGCSLYSHYIGKETEIQRLWLWLAQLHVMNTQYGTSDSTKVKPTCPWLQSPCSFFYTLLYSHQKLVGRILRRPRSVPEKWKESLSTSE